jgi:hypothetical protein
MKLNGKVGCLVLATGLSLVACGEDSKNGSASDDAAAPLYVVESLIFGDEGRASYVSLLPALAKRDKVLLKDAREFAEYAPADAHGGKIIVGSGEGPTLTRFGVSEQGVWSEEETISFASYMSEPLDASVYVSASKAYVPFDRTNHLIWNPETFEIMAELGAPESIPLTRDTLKIWRGYSHVLRGDTMFQPYYWADESFHAYSQISQISVIDTATDKVKAVLDAPCPHLHIASQDEAGNIYLSNGQGSIAAAVLDPEQPRNCVVRIKAGEERIDEAFTMSFADLAEGREGSNFFHVADNLVLFNVYHGERDKLGPDAEFADVDFSANYHIWTYDLETKEAKLMPGLDYGGGQFVAFRIDGRVFLTIPAADYSNTQVFEALPDGTAEKLFDVEGWAFKMFRAR